MTHSNGDRPVSLAGLWWYLLGLLAFMIGALAMIVAMEHFPLWLYADHYVAAELEVTRFHPQRSRRSSGPPDRATIEGIIHPGGERVLAKSVHLAIAQFVDPNDTTGRRLPLRGEIEGQRLAVWYWPEHDDVTCWWHAPTVVRPEAVARARDLVVPTVLIGAAFVGVGLYCFRCVYRHAKLAAPPEPSQTERQPTLVWVWIALLALYGGVLGLVVFLMS